MRKWVVIGMGMLAYLWWRKRSSPAVVPATTVPATPISDRSAMFLDIPVEQPAPVVPSLQQLYNTKWKDTGTGLTTITVTNVWVNDDAVELDDGGMTTQITGSHFLDLIRQGVYVPA